jgi:hypothetical protein
MEITGCINSPVWVMGAENSTSFLELQEAVTKPKLAHTSNTRHSFIGYFLIKVLQLLLIINGFSHSKVPTKKDFLQKMILFWLESEVNLPLFGEKEIDFIK